MLPLYSRHAIEVRSQRNCLNFPPDRWGSSDRFVSIGIKSQSYGDDAVSHRRIESRLPVHASCLELFHEIHQHRLRVTSTRVILIKPASW